MTATRNLILTLLGLTAMCAASAQSCEVSYGFTQSFSTAFFEAEYSVPEGYAITGTSWNFGDGTTGSQGQPIHTFPFYGTFHCCVVLTTMNADGTVCEVEYCETIEMVQPQPCAVNADFAFTTAQDGEVALIPTLDSGVGTTISTVTWELGDGTTANNPEAWSHTYAAPGTVSVCLTVDGQSTSGTCTSNICKDIDVAPFHCLVKAGMALGTEECNLAATLETYLEGQTEVDEVNWTVDGNWASEAGVLEVLMEAGEGAEICVEVEASSPGSTCSATECLWVDSPCDPQSATGIEEQTADFTLYPNPAVNLVRIDGFTAGTVRVFALSGALVLESTTNVLDCSALTSGLYVVEVRNGSAASRQQLAIQ